MILQQPWWLLAACLCALGYFLFIARRHDDWEQAIRRPVLSYLKHGEKNKPRRQIGWLVAVLGCLALTGPSIEAQDKNAYRHTQGWVVIADVSRSMTLNDVVPSRLSAMRDTALELAKHAGASSTTLIVYAGDAFVITPPSFDTNNFSNSANLLSYGVVPMDGSNVTRALSLALSVIEDSHLVNARLFVLSDTGGFNTRSTAAVARIADLGHRTDLILFGDAADNTAEFDIEVASSMANSGNGVLVRADSVGSVDFSKLNLDQVFLDNKLLSQSGLTTLVWSNQSHWILLCCIPLMLLMFYREFRS